MNTTDITRFKERLEAEHARLVEDLSRLGRINPTNPNDWETTYSDLTNPTGEKEVPAEPDTQDEASRMEGFEERNATEVTLEAQFNAVKAALKRIEDGSYGLCHEAGEAHEIEIARLEANPSAATCIAHLKN